MLQEKGNNNKDQIDTEHPIHRTLTSGSKTFLSVTEIWVWWTSSGPSFKQRMLKWQKCCLIVWVIFGRRLLCSVSMSAFYSFLKCLRYTANRHRQVWKITTQVLVFNRLGATPTARPQQTAIFGGAKWCNLLLRLTNTKVCENFGGAIGQLPPHLVAGLIFSRKC